MLDPSAIWVNIAAFHFMNGIASPLLNAIMEIISESYIIVLPLIAIYLILKKDSSVYAFIFACVLLFAIGYGLKSIFMEPRPCATPSLSWINAPSCESGYSFPSDHAMVLTGLLFFVVKYKRTFGAYVLWLLVVLFARVYLGQHYVTDIVAGMLLSIFIGYAVYLCRDLIYYTLRKYGLALFTADKAKRHSH